MTLNHLIQRFDFGSDVTAGHFVVTGPRSVVGLFVYKSAKLLQANKGALCAAGIKSSRCPVPKSKDSVRGFRYCLAPTYCHLLRLKNMLRNIAKNCVEQSTATKTHGCHLDVGPTTKLSSRAR